MIVFRLSSTEFAHDLSGMGAKINGGRWNHGGIECVYTSESRALAVLEYTVNNEIYRIPRALSMVTIDTGKVTLRQLAERQLPGDWKRFPAPPSTKDFGSRLLKKPTKAILKIPSTIIPEEFNFILNPEHPEFAKFKILEIADFIYDLRIKLK
jgi:RES domain-containing protein